MKKCTYLASISQYFALRKGYFSAPPTAQGYSIMRSGRSSQGFWAASPSMTIYSLGVEEHNINLRVTLARAKARGSYPEAEQVHRLLLRP